MAIVQEIAVPAGQDPAEAAERFAQGLHAKWGVGRASCQNGVLLFIAISNRRAPACTRPPLPPCQAHRSLRAAEPHLSTVRAKTCRQIYISVGEGAKARLTQDVLGRIIDNAKLPLRSAK